MTKTRLTDGRAKHKCAAVVSLVVAAIVGNVSAATVEQPKTGETVATGQDSKPQPRAVSAAQRQMMRAQIGSRGTIFDENGQPVSSACFVANPTPEEFEEIMTRYQALPPPLVNGFGDRYFTAGSVWTGVGTLGSSGRASQAILSYSFPADGTLWGDGVNGPSAANDLNARLTTLFGAGNLDRGREFIRQSLASWRRYGGLVYSEVGDDNTAFSLNSAHTTVRGDVRIGSNAQGTGGTLAYNRFPGSSDMTLNSDYFPAGQGAFASATDNYRYFRNVVAHEHGHGLGYIHPIPCDNTKLMEPFINTNFEMTQMDERRGIARNYGDRFVGNNSGATARDFGTLTTPSVRSVVEQGLSTNGAGGVNNTDEDWFRFTLGTAQAVTISVVPIGGTSTQGEQSNGCNGTTASVNATLAGNLNVELRNGANGVTVLQTASGGAAGVTESISAGTLAAGTYWVRVFDVGTNPSENQIVQLYNLLIRLGAAKAPPTAIAGLSKRVQANTNAFFMGSLNSYTNDTNAGGGTNNITTYAWDLDGDGTFEVANNANPSRTYTSNGTYPATLRITDENGLTSTDTINVVVFGATTSVASVTPNNANQGQTVAVTINGNNLKNVTASSQVTVSGTGVTVTGTPVPNILGTQVTGLSFVISGGAAISTRNVTVSNADGTGVGTSLFTVNSGVCVAAGVGTSPTNQSACPGAAASFTVVPSGSTPHTFQWRKAGVNIGGATSGTFTLSSVVAGDAANYDCIVTNSCGNATSASASLSVRTVATVTGDPTTQTPCIGTPASFSVTATGSSPVTYQWRKNAVNIGGQIAPTLNIASVVAGDAGSYACVVTNDCGSDTSVAVALTVRTGVSISTQPVPVTVCEGEPLSFGVSVSGTAPFTYQWRKNGVNLLGGAGPNYTINPANTTNAGTYVCVVTNVCGSITTNGALLVVNTYPIITTQPVSQSVCIGGSVTFTSAATGTAPLTFQWRKNGVDIGGATGTGYTIPVIAAGDVGNYDCSITSLCGIDVTATAALSLSSGPTIGTQPAGATVCQNAPASFSVAATGTAPITYQWRKGGSPIGGATSNSYVIAAAITSDAGSYDCVVTDLCGNTISTAGVLVVNALPSITTQPVAQSPCLGAGATFSLTATGAPTLTYQWRKGGTPIGGATASTYTIAVVVAGDAASYDCVVTNTCGSATSDAAALTVQNALAITTQPAASQVCTGTPANFGVAITGSTPVTYQWRKGGVAIGGATSAAYSIPAPAPADVATYDCVITNICGSLTSTGAALTLLDPPSITTQPVAISACTGSAVALSVGTSGSPPLAFQWKKDGVDVSGATSGTLAFTSLTAADVGSYTCAVTNACGLATSNSASVGVEPGPTITLQPNGLSTCEGATFNLSLTAIGATSYQWRRNATPVSDGPTGSGSTLAGTATPTLTITSVDSSDAASYDCVISASCGTISSDAAIVAIGLSPVITLQPESQFKCLGGSVTFTTAATGSGPLIHQWRKNTLAIGGATADSLVVSPVVTGSAGSYDCVVTNDCGEATSNGATLLPCISDFNCSGIISVQDIFDFLAAYFSGQPNADVNDSGVISVQDIFDFLSAYFAGCA